MFSNHVRHILTCALDNNILHNPIIISSILMKCPRADFLKLLAIFYSAVQVFLFLGQPHEWFTNYILSSDYVMLDCNKLMIINEVFAVDCSSVSIFQGGKVPCFMLYTRGDSIACYYLSLSSLWKWFAQVLAIQDLYIWVYLVHKASIKRCVRRIPTSVNEVWVASRMQWTDLDTNGHYTLCWRTSIISHRGVANYCSSEWGEKRGQ